MPKNPIFIGFFAHPSKASSAIMQQQGSKAKTPQKKGAHFFSQTPFLTKIFFKNTNFAPPPENCAQKIYKKTLFLKAQKRWPSYWPYHGQVIDPKMAKKWPSYWPYNIYIYIAMVSHLDALHPPPLNGPVAPVAGQVTGVLHVNLPLKGCHATRGCSSYTCKCRATLCNYAPVEEWTF